jgi:hypothetical protein
MDATPLPRFVADRIHVNLADTPAVLVNGPRQSGKTTLVRQLATGTRSYLTLDDDAVLAAATGDPAGFVRGLDQVVIDEVQRAPDLLRAIKRSIDQDRRPGRFLLTGSSNILMLPRVADSLAGRMSVVTLLPFSRAEVQRRKASFLAKAVNGTLVRAPERLHGDGLVQAALSGGYPEMMRRRTPARARAWARDYLKAIVERDVRDIADVEKLDRLPRLLRVLAEYAGHLANFQRIGGENGLDDKTTKKYVAILEQLYLVQRVEPWFRNRLKRLVKTPKLHFLDSGLLAATAGLTLERVATDRARLGPLLETFVFAEVLKQIACSEDTWMVFHYRDKDQDEVDFVIEHESGRIVGVEVKASATVRAADFKGLRKLAAATGRRFALGVVVYDGDTTVPFGDRLYAAPVSCVWG